MSQELEPRSSVILEMFYVWVFADADEKALFWFSIYLGFIATAAYAHQSYYGHAHEA